MADILEWMIQIGWKLALWSITWALLRQFIKNGKGALKDILETTRLAIHCGCLAAKDRLITKLKERKEKEEDDEPDDDKECKVWGTVR